MIMHRSIWSDNGQSSRRRFKAIEIAMQSQSQRFFVLYAERNYRLKAFLSSVSLYILDQIIVSDLDTNVRKLAS